MPTSKNVKKIYRSTKDRWIAGVCAGFAEYFGIDPNVMRLIWVLVSLLAPVGVIIYLIAWFVIPEKPRGK